MSHERDTSRSPAFSCTQALFSVLLAISGLFVLPGGVLGGNSAVAAFGALSAMLSGVALVAVADERHLTGDGIHLRVRERSFRAPTRPVGPRARCAFCHDGFQVDLARECEGCQAIYHRACVAELEGCATLGCKHLSRQVKGRRRA